MSNSSTYSSNRKVVVSEKASLSTIFSGHSLFDLTLYNTGTIASGATIAYLGAKKRKASAHALFMIHRTQTTTQFANTQAIKSLADSAVINDQRTEAILRQHITMPREKWSQFDYRDIFFTAEESVQAGISDEISEFSPPAGTRIFNV
jgi:ATP-dependent protease ClpP protease subunit